MGKTVKLYISADGGNTWKPITCVEQNGIVVYGFPCDYLPVTKKELPVRKCLAADYIIRSCTS